jgi:hypothetical protein
MKKFLIIGLVIALFVLSVPASAVVASQDWKIGNTTSSQSALRIDKPVGVVEGDLLLAQITYNDGTSVSSISTPSSDWTLLRYAPDNNLGEAICYKVASDSEPAFYTWTFRSGGGSARNTMATGGITRFTGVDITNPVYDGNGEHSMNDGNSNDLTADGFTATARTGSMLVAFFSLDAKQSNLNVPAGMNEIYDVQNIDGTGLTSSIATLTWNSGNPNDKTSYNDFATTHWVTHQYAIRAAATVANDQSVTTNEDTAKAITLVANNLYGNPITYQIVDDPLHGTLSGSSSSRTYTPDANYNGPDSFTFRGRTGSPGSYSYSNTATVTITVSPVNDAPVAYAQSQTTNEDTAKSITLTGSDVDGDTLTFSVVASPSHGSLSGSPPALTYTPTANYYGTDSFTFKANDGTVDSNTATVSITVNAVASVTPTTSDGYPTCGNVGGCTGPSVSFTYSGSGGNDIPAGGSHTHSPVTITVSADRKSFSWTSTEPVEAVVVRNNYGSGNYHSYVYKYTPNVQISDGGLVARDSDTINEIRFCYDNAPVLTGVPATTSGDELTLITFTGHATDTNSPPQTLTFSLVGAPAGANVGSSSGVFTWTPTEAQGPGVYPFTVRVSDGVSNTDAAISITVNEATDPTITLLPLSPLPGGIVSSEYSDLQITASGGTGPYSFSKTSGDLPPGLSLSPEGIISGTPTATGYYDFTITATDANSYTGSMDYGIDVDEADPSVPVPEFPSMALPAAFIVGLIGAVLFIKSSKED